MDPNANGVDPKTVNLSVVHENEREIDEDEFKSCFSARSNSLWVKELKEKLNDHTNLIDYFISYKIENIEGLIKMYEKEGDEFLQTIWERQDSFFKHSSGKYTVDLALGKEGDNLYFNNLAMEVMDRVPAIDRPTLPISKVIKIIPRQLFK